MRGKKARRWSFKPELGFSQRLGNWVLDAYGGVWFFTENPEFFSRNAYVPGQAISWMFAGADDDERVAVLRQVDHGLPAEELAPQRVGGIDRDEVLLEHADAVTQPLRLVQVVGAEEDGAALAAEGLDEVAHGLGCLRVQRGRRLVEEHDRRLVQQGARNRKLLLHALRERACLGVTTIPQVQQPQVLLDLPAHIPDAVELCEDREVVARAQIPGRFAQGLSL
mgnify:CR=1 FL=1